MYLLRILYSNSSNKFIVEMNKKIFIITTLVLVALLYCESSAWS